MSRHGHGPLNSSAAIVKQSALIDRTIHDCSSPPPKVTNNFEAPPEQPQQFKMADTTPKTYSNDPALYLYTSLTSGSSHIVTATSRMETILKANRIPFLALDIATDEKARMLWGRRAGKDESGRPRKIPGLVQMGLVIGVCSHTQ
jgi:SH3-binding, glutamic acid-rich protein